jgi:hypothetical protein
MNDRKKINNELEIIWNEVVVSYLKVLHGHLPGGTLELRRSQSEFLKVQPRSKPCTSRVKVRLLIALVK